MTGPLVLESGAGEVLDVFGSTLTLKAMSSDTGGAYSLFEGRFEPGGFRPLPHIHPDGDEGFYVLEGLFDFHVGGGTVRGAPGTFLLVPRGTLHSFTNVSDTPARLLFLHSPPLDEFFLELARLAESGPPDPATIAALMRKWGMDVPSP